MERLSLDGLKMLLVFDTPEPVTVELHGDAGAFPLGIPPGPLCGELLRCHLLLGMNKSAKWNQKTLRNGDLRLEIQGIQ